jgi:N6-L-threonylcarbamoyladenine synthase
MIHPHFTILAIDTSCDETSAAVTSDLRILANIIASQVEIHKKYGGVYPTEAKRAHQQNIDPVIREALRRWQIALHRTTRGQALKAFSRPDPFKTIDAIAVTVGPGLAPALEVGIQKAKQLAVKHHKPLIAVNHLEGHLLSPLAQNSRGNNYHPDSFTLRSFSKVWPALALLVSGGHTQLVLVNSIGDYQLLGETRDDAAGECFDKVARLLNLGYPGGPIISELAKVGNPTAYDLPIPMKDDPSLDFSFSGLKTACKYFLQQHHLTTKEQIQDFCASFQATVVCALLLKVESALQLSSLNDSRNMSSPVGTRHGAHPQRRNVIHPVQKIPPIKSIWLGGGVGANWQLRRELRKLARRYHLPLFTPYSHVLFTDNAAIIGIAAYFQARHGDFVKNMRRLDRQPNLNL